MAVYQDKVSSAHHTWFRERTFDRAAVVGSKLVPRRHPSVA